LLATPAGARLVFGFARLPARERANRGAARDSLLKGVLRCAGERFDGTAP
jgi:hypothetical protein